MGSAAGRALCRDSVGPAGQGRGWLSIGHGMLEITFLLCQTPWMCKWVPNSHWEQQEFGPSKDLGWSLHAHQLSGCAGGGIPKGLYCGSNPSLIC